MVWHIFEQVVVPLSSLEPIVVSSCLTFDEYARLAHTVQQIFYISISVLPVDTTKAQVGFKVTQGSTEYIAEFCSSSISNFIWQN